MADTFLHTAWPSLPSVPQDTKALLIRFFEVGDSSSTGASRRLGDEIFTQDGKIVVNKKIISGAAEISVSNHGMLSGLQSRKHQVDKVYTCGEAANDLILIGKVTWVLKNGQQLDGSFAARAVVVQKDGEAKLSLYQGWADMSELQAALTAQV